ncbi:hypothetical protein E1301_Tti010035 [Triplophysa tibetana]|uniref:Uncharacterized protein n=1 Tax=Triplophysa tibetana TaxID=1572043 RepID=A0A5A9NUK4_9TELE|nr:hypothetical protein E1301_Tti010035 [Triplophysa tibetana]
MRSEDKQRKDNTVMNESMENPAVLQKWLLKRKSREEQEKEEIPSDDENGCSTVPPQDEAEEDKESKPLDKVNVAYKEKQPRIQSVFTLVRSQIRTQAGLECQRVGILDVINQVKELENSKREQGEPAPTVKVTPSEEETLNQASQRETAEEKISEMQNDTNGTGQDECVALFKEVLWSLESLKKDLQEDLAQLRREIQSYMERELCGLETRLTNLLRTQTPSALPMETKQHRAPSMPPLGATRRRMLNRTFTTITPKTCPPLSLGPRSSSEPLSVSGAETGTGAHWHRRREMLNKPLGPLPPAQTLAHTNKKTLRSRTYVGKQTC